MNALELFKEILYSAWAVLVGMRMTFRNLIGGSIRSYYTMIGEKEPAQWQHGKRRRVTQMYPEEKWALAPRFRGMPTPTVDPESGQMHCIACLACVRICPTQIIDIQWHKPAPEENAVDVKGKKKVKIVDKFELDMGRCLFCALCVEVCPTDPKSIVMSREFELAGMSRQSMWFEDQLMPGTNMLPMLPVKGSDDQPETAYVNAATTMKKKGE
ncbi:MAG: 4Fe-4S dicluster domain-containing protein [Armatimonadota bacterium]|nr:4Fe-4S dicluster domain-containing protein [Armatimonadota bacterium]